MLRERPARCVKTDCDYIALHLRPSAIERFSEQLGLLSLKGGGTVLNWGKGQESSPAQPEGKQHRADTGNQGRDRRNLLREEHHRGHPHPPCGANNCKERE